MQGQHIPQIIHQKDFMNTQTGPFSKCPSTHQYLTCPYRVPSVLHKPHTFPAPRHMCTICGNTYANNNTLSVHYRIHTGERRYKCKTCGKTFTQSGTLRSHERTHTGEKPYHCHICGLGFAQCGSYRMHQKRHYIGHIHCSQLGCKLETQKKVQLSPQQVSSTEAKGENDVDPLHQVAKSSGNDIQQTTKHFHTNRISTTNSREINFRLEQSYNVPANPASGTTSEPSTASGVALHSSRYITSPPYTFVADGSLPLDNSGYPQRRFDSDKSGSCNREAVSTQTDLSKTCNLADYPYLHWARPGKCHNYTWESTASLSFDEPLDLTCHSKSAVFTS